MIEIGNHPDAHGIVMLHSTESGQFFACDRVEFERLAAMIKRGDLDAFLRMEQRSAVADGDADWAGIWGLTQMGQVPSGHPDANKPPGWGEHPRDCNCGGCP